MTNGLNDYSVGGFLKKWMNNINVYLLILLCDRGWEAKNNVHTHWKMILHTHDACAHTHICVRNPLFNQTYNFIKPVKVTT